MTLTKQNYAVLSRAHKTFNRIEFDWWGRKATVKCSPEGRGRDQIGFLDFTLDGVEVDDLHAYASIDESCDLIDLVNDETNLGDGMTLPLSDEFVAMLNRTFENHVLAEEYGIED